MSRCWPSVGGVGGEAAKMLRCWWPASLSVEMLVEKCLASLSVERWWRMA